MSEPITRARLRQARRILDRIPLSLVENDARRSARAIAVAALDALAEIRPADSPAKIIEREVTAMEGRHGCNTSELAVWRACEKYILTALRERGIDLSESEVSK